MTSRPRREERFATPSDLLDLPLLRRRTRRFLYLGLGVALSCHLGLALYLTLSQREEPVPKPQTVEFLVRQPRMTKPFELKKKRVPQRVMTRRVSTARPEQVRTLSKRIDRPDVFGTVATVSYSVEDGAALGDEVVMPAHSAAQVASFKEPGKRISMQEEFIDVRALDTGKYKALVIQDPQNRQDIKGFVHLALAWGTDLEPKAPRAVPKLVEAMNRYTGIEARVDNHLFIDSSELLETPFVYITADDAFEITEKEIESLRRYLESGGFILADNGVAELEYGPGEASLRKMFKQVLGNKARFRNLPNDHPIYHCFFDFDGPPPGEEVSRKALVSGERRGVLTGDTRGIQHALSKPVHFLEGIYLGDRLVAVYSDKAYGKYWEREYENEPQLKMGVNMVVFALTQQGSIAQQHIDFYEHSASR